jgi:hypothetical protein
MNVELLQKVKQAILAEADRFDMHSWAETEQRDLSCSIASKPSCGTTCCIGGWAAAIHNQLHDDSLHYMKGNLALGISAASQLFYVEEWPLVFSRAYEKETSPRERARIAAERIDFFIEKGY